MKKKTSSPKTAESGKLKKALSCWQLYILLIPALIWLIVFAYYPMYGLIIAFKDFKGRMGIMGSPWADPIFKYFKMFFSTSIAMTAIKNTIVISLESLIIGFPIPVIFALLLNQVQRSGPRRIIQTISYAPYFMSNVVVVSLISVLFSANGLVNHAVMGAGGRSEIPGLQKSDDYPNIMRRSSSGAVAARSLNSFLSTSSTAGETNAGIVGPRIIFFSPR